MKMTKEYRAAQDRDDVCREVVDHILKLWRLTNYTNGNMVNFYDLASHFVGAALLYPNYYTHPSVNRTMGHIGMQALDFTIQLALRRPL